MPETYQIPAIINNNPAIISRNNTTICNIEDQQFLKLLQDAHLQIQTTQAEEPEIKPSVAEINQMCNTFAEIEGVGSPLIEFDIERIIETINIEEAYKQKLTGLFRNCRGHWLEEYAKG